MRGRASKRSFHITRRAAALVFFAVSAPGAIGLTAGQAGQVREARQARMTQSSGDGVWQRVTEAARAVAPAGRQLPAAYHVARLDTVTFTRLIAEVRMESAGATAVSSSVLTVPLPDGTYGRFRLQETSMMEPALAAQTGIRTYMGQGLDDPTASARFDWGPQGFHGFILSTGDTVYVDPLPGGDPDHYMTFYKRDALREQDQAFQCQVVPADSEAARLKRRTVTAPVVTNGTSLRTYRTVVAATGEYTQFFRMGTDTDDQAIDRAQAAIVTAMNRINGIYERDLAVRLTLVSNNRSVVYANAATDPYTGDNSSLMLTENQTNLTAAIGGANYDIGHVLTGATGGGIATTPSVCSTAQKAQGMTGGTSPVGDGFVVDFVAHEFGHQFGGSHTYNAASGGSCTTREASAAFEPSSGSTIMAYGGICSPNDIVTNSHDNFHVRSLEEMTAVLNDPGEGGSCGTVAAPHNTAPVANAGSNVVIPKSTPFTLTGGGTDANGDTLSFSWEEYDLGAPSTLVNANSTDSPLFRAYAPTSSAARTFPSLQHIRTNANVPPATYTCGGRVTPCRTGEVLPAVARTMRFQLVVRDNNGSGGAVNSAQMQVQVDGNSGPFNVTAPNTAVSLTGGTSAPVTWDVANTTAAPVSVASVKISLSIDGGVTFPTVLAASTANDGSESVTLPNTPTAQARVKVEANGSVFFDMSDANFTITPGAGGGNAAPTIAITTPAATPSVGTSPFVTLAGTAADDASVVSVTWSSDRGASGTASGTTAWSADVPLVAGANVFTVTATDAQGVTGMASVTINVSSFTYFLAEGATGAFFDLELLIGNPNAVAAPATIQYLKEDGTVVTQSLTLTATSRRTIIVDGIAGLESTAVSAIITSTSALPLLVERTMRWDATGYGAHTEKAMAGTHLNWFFAEGSQGFFDTYLLLANPNASANTATVNFLTESSGVITRTYSLLPNARLTVHAGSIPQLVGTSFGITVAFAQPGAAERAMYFGTPLFNGGHESAGVNQAATSWYHAEGATGTYFDTYVLVSNPNTTAATVTFRFLLDSGAVIAKSKTVPANGRITVNVEAEDAALANVAVATEVTSNIPVISERAMYWAGAFSNWFETHNSFGVTALGTKWGLGEGRVGGTASFDNYILLANPGATAATVTITYLRTTGATITKTYTVNAASRFNVHVNSMVSELANEHFSAVITSTVPIAVERALYSNAGGVVWAAGTNATGIRLP